jgi:hypothetical protein
VDLKAVLERLRDPGREELGKLADRLVELDLATPLERLFPPREVAAALVAAARAWFDSDAAEQWTLELGARIRDALREKRAPLSELVGDDVSGGILALAQRPHTPARELVLFLLDREPMRALLRELFFDALVSFGRKMRAPVMENPLSRGLGGLGRFARDKARSHALGVFATDMVGALSEEVERQVDRKAAELADAAIASLIPRLVDLLSNPTKAGEQAALRSELLEGVLELRSDAVADELEKIAPAERSRIVRVAIASWLDREDAEPEVEALLHTLLGGDASRTMGELLEELDMLEAYGTLAREIAIRRMADLVQTDAFATWLGALLA